MSHRQIQIRAPAGLWPLTWPMGLTMLRLVLLPVFLWLILVDAGESDRPYRWWAIGVFAIMAVTDKLDGYLARRLNQTSKLGTLLDPIADKLLVACSLILLSFPMIATERFRIPQAVVAAIYVSYLIIVIGTIVVLAVVGKVSIVPRPLGKLGTALQLGLVLLTLIAPMLGSVTQGVMYRILLVFWWVVPILALITCADYIIQGVLQLAAARKERQSRDVSLDSGPEAHG